MNNQRRASFICAYAKMNSSSKLIVLRRIVTATLKSPASSSSTSRSLVCPLYLLEASNYSKSRTSFSSLSGSFCSRPSNRIDDVSQGPVAVDYSSLLQEDEFHRLADSTIHEILEKIEEYGDSVDIDGFDIDYGNQVLTVKLGNLGTYVLNKQTPNRQIWMSSPVSGPSRFDWDQNAHAWIYRRNKEYLLKTLESELEQLCGKPISLS